ncbi:uncharacterized protein LOC119436617 isoform X2 [Dermacentor silvarum]|uniref:uncharacterized protein LOC119436617 isoform X2 n=1 Tax=Dermacentor silvarum TaxID=543639 RepID=UPI002100AAAD|nr:uncharacterized protein LOC119436617 isoform X2 [Dermacentor silvarum]
MTNSEIALSQPLNAAVLRLWAMLPRWHHKRHRMLVAAVTTSKILTKHQKHIGSFSLRLTVLRCYCGPAIPKPFLSLLVTNSPSVSPNPNHSSSRKSSKKKAHRKRRQGSVSQSVADSKYSTNSPSSSTVNDEIFVPLTDSKSSAAMELTILEASPIDSADIPTVLVQPPSSTPSITASKDEQILEALREIVRNCTVQDPEKRPSATQVHTMLSKLL